MNDCPSYYPENMYSSPLMRAFCDSVLRREVLMNYKKYQEEVKKARDNYYRIRNEIDSLERVQVGTDYNISLCRELLRVSTLIRALEAVDIPVPVIEVKEDAEL